MSTDFTFRKVSYREKRQCQVLNNEVLGSKFWQCKNQNPFGTLFQEPNQADSNNRATVDRQLVAICQRVEAQDFLLYSRDSKYDKNVPLFEKKTTKLEIKDLFPYLATNFL